ncbi:hypothetical protein SAMD00019534_101080 [Acytostelium subglobosum LB1]|uniref:hypothetical protein n=1 Tax=Acytostelium subglobosum LB1 TaxID=1410327 RepID=UPI000644FE83|nr:hypothetical protein SAMD00019534_101080 [Acytostelium subglobosum LB1]GAM26933.1 hypothetical protein SAMD00019534_101080 [Acytostelium subglobosum LB1]|eukprot:XP_012750201.1 hypothetical protein SAMD00019534_101080 [Acytostelium subglobosum LB1]
MSTIKGANLEANGDLNQMLQYNATEMFIKTFERVYNNNNTNTYTYQLNNHLLYLSARYNNDVVFIYLLNNPRMPLSNEHFRITSFICTHGNTDMLQHYLDATAYRSLPSDLITDLPLAIDSGNEQFVRLFLQHLTFNKHTAKDLVTNVQFKRPGVSIGMIRLLHEEFNCLFSYSDLWQAALINSIKHNMLESV